MAIVVYKCDVCKREKEYQRDIEGIEKVQRCTITHGCRGKLFQVNLFDDYVRASVPDRVLGLDDWRQRRVLYNHVQSIARDNWVIEHNLGTFPSISVFVNIPIEGNPENIEEIVPEDTIIVDDDNMVLVFDRAWSGLAQLVARQSDPNLLKPFTRTVGLDAQVLQQISNNGEIAIATRVDSVGICSNVDLVVRYTTTQNTVVEKTYTAPDNLLDSTSTWRDFDNVLIKGKIYTIRSYQAVYSDMLDETVASGSTFRFTGIVTNPTCSPIDSTPRTVAQDEVYVLFASEPFDTIDKITDKYIDVFDITELENTFSLLYDTGEFFADTTIIQDTYPPIRQV